MRRKAMEEKIKNILFNNNSGTKKIRLVFLSQAKKEDIGIIFDLYHSRQIRLSEFDLEKLIRAHGSSLKVDKENRTFDIILGPHILRGWFALRMSGAISDIEEVEMSALAKGGE